VQLRSRTGKPPLLGVAAVTLLLSCGERPEAVTQQEVQGPDPVAVTAAQEATARHVRDALRALGCGYGIHWAADITTLPLRFVVRVARAHGMTDAADEYDGWTGYSLAGLLDVPSRIGVPFPGRDEDEEGSR
jgi:hypothetical protein